jgi:hypothetical protein
VCDFIESYLVFGPGDLRGQPARLDPEKRGLIYRMYECYPQGHPQAGRRRFKRVAISLRKGSAKSEFDAWLAAVELHPDGPVRCVGWNGHGDPIGGPVNDPYVPMVAFTDEQSEELAYGALKCILEESVLAKDFDIGIQRIMRLNGDGKAVHLATSPNARDGARTTFQVFDETHRLTLPAQRMAHKTMLANIPKRKIADAWSLETTTAYAPGEASVAEDTMEFARQIESGKVTEPQLFFFHRQAADTLNLFKSDNSLDYDAVRQGVIEASGPVAEWSDIDSIVGMFADPTSDLALLRRLWLNQILQGSARAFNVEKWRALVRPGYMPADSALITIGFDGAPYHDSTGLVGTEVETGFQWLVAGWERPYNAKEWEVPKAELNEAVDAAFARWDVWRLYADPYWWEDTIAAWMGRFGKNAQGEDRVWEWRTNRLKPMAECLQAYRNAILGGEVSNDGSPRMATHVGNACKHELNLIDAEGHRLWTVYKERPDSPHKIDFLVCGALSWEARRDAVAAGMTGNRSIYEDRGILTFG